MSFEDLLANNLAYADGFADGGFDGIAKAGIAMVTCMDSRIEPLAMLGLRLGDAKVLRSPGGRVSTSVLTGCVLSVQLLHGSNLEGVELLRERLNQVYTCWYNKTVPVAPVLGAHTGTSLVGLAVAPLEIFNIPELQIVPPAVG